MYAIPGKRGEGEWMYRLLSAFAHGMQWSVLLGEIGVSREIPNLRGIHVARLTSNDQVTLFAGRTGRLTPARHRDRGTCSGPE